jgi:hypothetical protein
MPLSRTAFCYIDDNMEQFGSHSIFYKTEIRRDQTYHMLFLGKRVEEFRQIYMFRLEDDEITIVYRTDDFGSPKTLILSKIPRYSFEKPEFTNVEMIEFYEWLRERLFSSPTHHPDESSSPSLQSQTCPSASCIQASQGDSPSSPLPTLPWTQSDPTCSSSGPSSSGRPTCDVPSRA